MNYYCYDYKEDFCDGLRFSIIIRESLKSFWVLKKNGDLDFNP